MDHISSFNDKIDSLLKNKQKIQKQVEDHETTRLELISEITVLKKELASKQDDDNNVQLKITETMCNTLKDLNLKMNTQSNHSDLLRKCRYYNRGHCKFKENCHFSILLQCVPHS